MIQAILRLPFTWSRRRVSRRAVAVGLTAALAAALLVSTTGRARAAVPIRCHPQAVSVGGGVLHNYYLVDGKFMGAGNNWAGQLGDGTTIGKNLPVEALDLTGLTTVASSPQAGHSLALSADGHVYAWGENDYGQLGTGDLAWEDTPQRVSGVDEVVAVTAGAGHSLALTEDGTVWAWGRNDDGELGDGGSINSPVPVQVQGLTDVVAISAGSDHSLAATKSGEVWAWGENDHGQLGLGYVDFGAHALPEKVTGLTGIVAVAGGKSHSLALKSDGTAYGWGDNDTGAVGDGTPIVGEGTRPSPVQVADLTSIEAISAGYQHSMALKTDGTVWTWGYSSNGQLGNGWYGFGAWTSTPMQVSGLSSIETIATPSNQSIAVHANGTIYAWGANFDGQLGLGDYTDRANPEALTVISQSKPDKPTTVEAVAGEELALVTWEPPASTVTQYVVTPYENGVAQAPIATELPKLEYAADALTEGASYDFEVEAQNCLGASPASDKSNQVVPTGVQLHDEGFSLERQRVNDRHALKTNVFNGNLKLTASDLAISGTGLNVGIERAYSSRSDASGIFGNRWSTSIGADTSIEELSTGDAVYLHTGGGAYFGFAHTGGGSYDPPAGIDATLTKLGDGTYKLQYHFSDEIWTFDADGKLKTRTDRNGNQISFTYDAVTGLLTKLTDTQNREVTFTYTLGRVTQMDGPLGRVWKYSYDLDGNLETYTDPEGNITKYEYDADGNLTAIITPGDQRPSSPIGTRRVEFTYDTSSRVKTITWPQADGSPTTSFDYQILNTVVTDGNGGETTYRFDEVGRTTDVVDSLGNSVSTDYTSNSNVRRHSIGQATTTYGYSNVNALTSQSFDTGAHYTLTYGDSSHPHLPTIVEDPQGNETALAYDTVGNLGAVTNDLPTDNQVLVDYNSQGRPTKITDAMGNPTQYGYDTDGNLTSVDPPSPLGDIAPIVYDAVSRIRSINDGKGNVTTYEYDNLDRIEKIDYASGPTYTYEYDGDGNPITMTGPSGTTTMEYDERNLLVSRTTPDGHTITYDHDGMGNLREINEDGNTTTYGYSAANLLSSVTGPDGAGTIISYDRDYNRTSFRYPNGVSLVSKYDDAKRLTKIAAVDENLDTLMSFEYSYEDPATGEDTTLRQSLTDHDGNVTAYEYDELNRLTDATTANADGETIRDEHYEYDGNSNLEEKTVDDGTATLTTTYHYNDANQLISVDGVVSRSYDANGNYARSSHGEEFTYNTANQTLGIRTASGVPARYTYIGPGQAERSEVDLEGIPVTSFTYTPLGISSEKLADEAATYYVRDDRGQILSQHGPGGVHYYLTDGLGSTVGLADSGGNVDATYRYGSFGNLINSSGLTDLTRFRYTGQYLDHTGLYKMGQRYYDPSTTRWTQQDPAYDPITPTQWNRYAYVGGDPINLVDPSGLNAVSDFFTKTVPCWGGKAWDYATEPFRAGWSVVGRLFLTPLVVLAGWAFGWSGATIAAVTVAVNAVWSAAGQLIQENKEFQYEKREKPQNASGGRC